MSKQTIYRPAVTRVKRTHSIRGVDYAVHEWGSADAPLIVYLHGWGDCGATWQFVVDALRGDWRVVAPDWRGFGHTHVDCSSFWFPDYLADLHALAAIVAPDEPLRLVGHSMGGNIASLYAGIMPERVRALVNIEGLGLPDSTPDDAPARYRDWIEQMQAAPSFSSYPDFAALAARIRKRNAGMTAPAAEFVAREWAQRDDDGVVRLRADPKHKLPYPVLYRRAEAAACWRAVTADVLLVTGATSWFIRKYGAVGDDMFAGAGRLVIEGAGHMPQFEAPEALAAGIEAFLAKHL